MHRSGPEKKQEKDIPGWERERHVGGWLRGVGQGSPQQHREFAWFLWGAQSRVQQEAQEGEPESLA